MYIETGQFHTVNSFLHGFSHLLSRKHWKQSRAFSKHSKKKINVFWSCAWSFRRHARYRHNEINNIIDHADFPVNVVQPVEKKLTRYAVCDLHCVQEKSNPCIHCHNSDKQCQILTEFWTNSAMSNCKQITKFK